MSLHQIPSAARTPLMLNVVAILIVAAAPTVHPPRSSSAQRRAIQRNAE